MDLITDFFDNVTARRIFNTPSLASVINDVPTWKLEKGGVYTVRIAYKDILNHDVVALQHRVPGNWNCIWSIKLPPKVKNFLWRVCRNCLPTRVRLQSKGVQCPAQCAVCEESDEDSSHLFFHV